MRLHVLRLGLILAAALTLSALAGCTTPPSQPTGWVYGTASK